MNGLCTSEAKSASQSESLSSSHDMASSKEPKKSGGERQPERGRTDRCRKNDYNSIEPESEDNSLMEGWKRSAMRFNSVDFSELLHLLVAKADCFCSLLALNKSSHYQFGNSSTERSKRELAAWVTLLFTSTSIQIGTKTFFVHRLTTASYGGQ